MACCDRNSADGRRRFQAALVIANTPSSFAAEAVLIARTRRKLECVSLQQHGVDDMLEHARSGDHPFRHVSDQDDGDGVLLGEPGQLRSAFAHLGDTPWG
jgi:hypothetical protein